MPVYQYFTYKDSRWHCNYCSKDFGNKSSTTLWRHLKSSHPKYYQEASKQESQEDQETIGEMDKYVHKTSVNVSLLFYSF